MAANFKRKPSTSTSQLRSCLVSWLSPDHEALLPKHLGAAAAYLGSSAVISSADPQVLHRVRVRLSALLQSHSSQLRMCGAELIYTLVDVDWESLASHGATWIKLLLMILERRNDNFTTLRAVIRALSKLFALTRGKPTLTRELATPNIPSFLASLIALSSSPDQLGPRTLSMTLPALLAIVLDNPTTFRPFASKLSNNILYPILNSSSQTGTAVRRDIEFLTRKLFVSIYRTVPKDQHMEWRISILRVIGETHKALSQTFDIVDENDNYDKVPSGWDATMDIQDSFVGVLRIEMLLRTLESFLNTSTHSRVQVPISSIVQLVDRLLSLDPENLQFKDSSDRIKQDFIASVLPSLHANVYGLLTTLVKTAGQSLLPHADTLLSHVATIPASRNPLYNIPIYTFLADFLSVVAFLPMHLYSEINHAIDLALSNLSSTQHAPSSLPDFASHPHAFISKPKSQVTIPAIKFLAAVVGTAPDLPATMRSLVDRFSIIGSQVELPDESLLLEVVQQPGRNIRWSVLPMAARRLPKNRNMSCILHPRFPPVPKRSEDILGSLSAADLEYLACKHKEQIGSDDDDEAESKPALAKQARTDRNLTLQDIASSEISAVLESDAPSVSSSSNAPVIEHVGESAMEDVELAQPHMSPTKTINPLAAELSGLNVVIEATSDRKRFRQSIPSENSKRPKTLERMTEVEAIVEALDSNSSRPGSMPVSNVASPVTSASHLTSSVEVTPTDRVTQTPVKADNVIEIGITTLSETEGVNQGDGTNAIAGVSDEATDTKTDDGKDNVDDFVLPTIDTEWSSDEN
ncbi:rRNA processing/ribosome biogenesis-domain-containing protein [Lipomyces kononenkoae]|uniref:rRNA processing/ribosome biogenesis-domain-containing protein n=1 Tax=Lipomyces kononenkoae TaxID=34357 RepID=A0ACC3T5L7_LIPKO